VSRHRAPDDVHVIAKAATVPAFVFSGVPEWLFWATAAGDVLGAMQLWSALATRGLHGTPHRPRLHCFRGSTQRQDAARRSQSRRQQATVPRPAFCKDIAMLSPPASRLATHVPLAMRADARVVPGPAWVYED
jgi:hypothetical protein